MAKYRMMGGFAMMPDRDMRMLKRMSSLGWHVVGITPTLFYRFEQGEPCDCEYALSYEQSFSDEMRAVYAAAGWTPVYEQQGLQILRAAADTTPLFTDSESEIDALEEKRAQAGKWALVFLAATLACVAWVAFDASSLVALLAFVAAAAGLVFSGFPFIGYSYSIRKIRQSME